MPRIEWTALPANVREHLLDRVRTRAVRVQDLSGAAGVDQHQA